MLNRAQAEEVLSSDLNLRIRIRAEGRPTFGTSRMFRWGACVKLATTAMLRGTLPAGAKVIIADAYSTHSWKPRGRTRRAWVDLPDGRSWEPVECTTMPTTRHHDLAQPVNVVAYSSADEVRAALAAVDGQVFRLINDGVPEGGLQMTEESWEVPAESYGFSLPAGISDIVFEEPAETFEAG